MKKFKDVYSYNNKGIFEGITKAWTSSGYTDDYLIPAHATEIEPPLFDSKIEHAIFNLKTNEWYVEKIPTEENTPKPEFNPLTHELKWKEDHWGLVELPPSPENTPKPDFDPETHELEWSDIKKQWNLFELPTPENTPKPDYSHHAPEEEYTIIWDVKNKNWTFKRKITWNYVKELRNSKMKQSDWIMLSDVSPKPSKEVWVEYRQALRDIPQKFSSPEEVIWPIPPQ
jgi:hypothetical protein